MTVGFAFDARLELDDLGSILTRRGLTPGGRVQTAVDEAGAALLCAQGAL